jgi:hypothetical protein
VLDWAGTAHGLCWAVLTVEEREMVLAGSGGGPKKGLEELEFEFEFEESIQIQIPHIGNTQNENQTRKSNNQFKTRKIAIKSEKTSNNHTNI